MSMTHSFPFPPLAFRCFTLTVYFNLYAMIQRGILCAILVGCNRWSIEYLNSRVE